MKAEPATTCLLCITRHGREFCSLQILYKIVWFISVNKDWIYAIPCYKHNVFDLHKQLIGIPLLLGTELKHRKMFNLFFKGTRFLLENLMDSMYVGFHMKF